MKFKRSFIGILCVLSIILLAGCGADNTDTQTNRQYEYFDVVEMINTGSYDDAKARIDEVYADADDYSTSKGYNKADLLHKLYSEQETYNEAMDVMLKVIKDNKYLDNLEKYENEASEEHMTFKITMSQISKLLNNVSEDKRAEVVSLISEDIINKYAEKEW